MVNIELFGHEKRKEDFSLDAGNPLALSYDGYKGKS
jgi:hypothetical protein